MRKQTKLVAVLSTAALLAIGASMTSFAATGWQEEDGTWVYYDKNEDKVTESWKKSGDNWFWLDSDGEMAIDTLVEDDDNYYYVDANGAMVRNQWVAIDNEDAGEENEPDHYWYYFQSNGKAYKRSESSNSLSPKTINGKRYAFDSEGKMLYGWINSSYERDDDDAAWQTAEYYLGDEDDGAVRTNEWALISIVDEDADSAQPGDDFWDEDQDRWFYFKASGKKQGESTNKKINGKRYGFDQYGRMVSSWNTTLNPVDKDDEKANMATNSQGQLVNVATSAQGSEVYTESFMYFSNPEDGARYTKGWFKVVAGYYLNQGNYEDDSEKWYYADGDGNLIANEIKRIKGKKYAFDNYGRMISGLALLDMADDTTINAKISSDSGSLQYETEEEFNETAANVAASSNYRFYYFGDGDDGAMKTGKQNVSLDGETISFKFETKSSAKGTGINGKDDDKYYLGGKLIKADKDDKFMVVEVQNDLVQYQTDGYQVSVKDLINAHGRKLTSSDAGYKKDCITWTFDENDMAKYRVVTCSLHLRKNHSLDDFSVEVGASRSTTLTRRVSTSYPRESHGSFAS